MPVSCAMAEVPPSCSKISGIVAIQHDYVNRSAHASDFTMSVGDYPLRKSHDVRMVTHDELLATMRDWVSQGKTRPKDLGDVLGLPSSRVSEMLGGRRRIQQHEMPKLVEFFGLGGQSSNVRKIKRIGQVPAGDLREAVAQSTDEIEVSADLPSGVFALEVDGESMNLVAPLGCDVIVDPNDKSLFAGDFYVVGDGRGGFTFKLFSQDPARLIPLSDDPSHTTIMLGAEPIEIIGRVVSVQLGAGVLRRLGRNLTSR